MVLVRPVAEPDIYTVPPKAAFVEKVNDKLEGPFVIEPALSLPKLSLLGDTEKLNDGLAVVALAEGP